MTPPSDEQRSDHFSPDRMTDITEAIMGMGEAFQVNNTGEIPDLFPPDELPGALPYALDPTQHYDPGPANLDLAFICPEGVYSQPADEDTIMSFGGPSELSFGPHGSTLEGTSRTQQSENVIRTDSELIAALNLPSVPSSSRMSKAKYRLRILTDYDLDGFKAQITMSSVRSAAVMLGLGHNGLRATLGFHKAKNKTPLNNLFKSAVASDGREYSIRFLDPTETIGKLHTWQKYEKSEGDKEEEAESWMELNPVSAREILIQKASPQARGVELAHFNEDPNKSYVMTASTLLEAVRIMLDQSVENVSTFHWNVQHRLSELKRDPDNAWVRVHNDYHVRRVDPVVWEVLGRRGWRPYDKVLDGNAPDKSEFSSKEALSHFTYNFINNPTII